MRSIPIALAALLLTAPLAAQAHAWERRPRAVCEAAGPAEGPPGKPHRRPPPFERVLERHADRLGLDEKTLDRIREAAAAARPEARALEERVRELRREMWQLLSRDEPDEQAIMHQAESIGAAEVEAAKRRLRTMLQIRALLTAEQRQELVKIHEEMKRRRAKRWRGAARPDAPTADPMQPSAD